MTGKKVVRPCCISCVLVKGSSELEFKKSGKKEKNQCLYPKQKLRVFLG